MLNDELTRIENSKADLKSAIEQKGVSVAPNETIDTYAEKVRGIKTGGGKTATVNFSGGEYDYGFDYIVFPNKQGKEFVMERFGINFAGKTIIMPLGSAITFSATEISQISVKVDKGSNFDCKCFNASGEQMVDNFGNNFEFNNDSMEPFAFTIQPKVKNASILSIQAV